MINFSLTILIALIGGYIANKKKVPAGYMLGALFAVATFNIIFNRALLPTYFKFVAQISTGTFIGSKFRSEDLKTLKKVIFPGLTMVALMIGFSFILSYIMSNFLGIDSVTAFFATAPGGVTDISLIAYEFNANTSQVTLLQLIRLISVISFVPFFARKCCEKIEKKENKIKIESEIKVETENKSKKEKSLFFTVLIGILGGIFGYFSKIPAGTMSCSMIAVALYNIKSQKAYMPPSLRKLVQAISGALLGARVVMEDIIALTNLTLPIFLIIIGFCLMNILVGFFIYKTTKFSLPTSLLSASPGGMSDISLMAEDLGANGPQVASMQFLRAIFIVAVYPIIIKILFT